MKLSRLAPSLALAALIFGSSTVASASAATSSNGHTSYLAHQTDVTCTGTNETPDESNLQQIREATLCLINRERVTRGERALVVNSHLEAAAQGHSTSMAVDDYFEHTSPSGQTPQSRMHASRYFTGRVPQVLGENIAWGTLWLASPRSIVQAWMESPGHRANILDPRFRTTGIGVYAQAPASLSQGQAGALYTQDFGSLSGD